MLDTIKTVLCFAVLVQSMTHGSSSDIDSSKAAQGENQCTTDDLNHSILVECDASSCLEKSKFEQELWPKNGNEAIHIYSTREGERFMAKKLPNLDYKEPENVRMLDINNTLYVDTYSSNLTRKIKGFGTTLKEKHFTYIKDNSFNKNYVPILKDLFGLTPNGLGFSILRLQLTRTLLLSNTRDIISLIEQIDQSMSSIFENTGSTKIKLVLSLEDIDDGSGLYESLLSLSRSLKESRRLVCWAIVINKEIEFRDDDLVLFDILKMFDAKSLLDSVNMETIKRSVSPIDGLTGDPKRSLLIKTEYSAPYNILRTLSESISLDNDLLTTSGFKRKIFTHGDWQNAQDYAVSILKNLKFGSSGFIEENSEIEVLADNELQDSSIYSIQNENNIHFRSPMYYAMGHFSRYVKEGSMVLKINVTTAPNMFAAHYSAFLLPDKNSVVAIVLNDNEHLLPFRLAIDGSIKVFTDLKPKSFNTFVVEK